MGNYRSTDTFPLAAGAAVGGAAVAGGIAAGTEAVGDFISDYRAHIANGGAHIPEVLMVPLVALGLGVGYLIETLAAHPEVVPMGKMGSTETLLFWSFIVFSTWIWIVFVGGIFTATISAGKGAVFNAVAPIACAIGYAMHTGSTYNGAKALLIWLGIRIVCAGLTQFSAYRTLRITVLGIPAAAMVIMPLYMLMASAGYLPGLSPRTNATIEQVFSFEPVDHATDRRFSRS